MIYPIGLSSALTVNVLELGAFFIFLAAYSVIFQLRSLKCDPTLNKNKPCVPPPSMRLFVTRFYLYVMTFCFRYAFFSVNNNNFLRDISKRQLLWVKVTGIISPQETHFEHLSLGASQMLSLLCIPHFWHYNLFLCNHCKKVFHYNFQQ